MFSLAEVDGVFIPFPKCVIKENCLFIFGVRKTWKERELQRTDAGKISTTYLKG